MKRAGGEVDLVTNKKVLYLTHGRSWDEGWLQSWVEGFDVGCCEGSKVDKMVLKTVGRLELKKVDSWDVIIIIIEKIIIIIIIIILILIII